MNSSKAKVPYPNAAAVIQQISIATKGERCIFRGEPVIYKYPFSSALFRQLKEENATARGIPSLIRGRQNKLIEMIRSYKEEGDSDLERLVAYQHKGGKTNLLDFTGNVHIALFFACRNENHMEDDGWLIVKSKKAFRELTSESSLSDDEAVLLTPPGHLKRARDQRAVLLHIPEGFLPFEAEETIVIKAAWKQEILEYLKNSHDISYETIYDDMLGIIEVLNQEEGRKRGDTQPSTDLKGFAKPRDKKEALTLEYYLRLLMAASTEHYNDLLNSYAVALIESFTKTLKRNPQDPETYYNRAFVYQSRPSPNYKMALKDYNRAIELNPDYAEAYNNRGKVYSEIFPPEYENAMKNYNRAIELNPDYAEAYDNRGATYIKKTDPDYDAAISDYSRAMELNPDYVEAYNNRGNAYTKKPNPDYDLAISDYTRAIELNPDYAEAYNNRGSAYINKLNPDYDAAISDCNRAIELNPDYAEAYNNRGKVYSAMSPPDYEKALMDYGRVIELNPGYAEVYNNRGSAYSEMSPPDYEKALMDYGRAIELKPDLAVPYNNRGNAYSEMSPPDYDKAISDYNRAIELDPELAIAYSNRGNVYAKKKDYDKAISDYNRAIELDPKHAIAYSNRGVSYFAKPEKDYERVLRDLNQALKLNPHLAKTYFLRGTVSAILKDYASARNDYHTALKEDSAIANYPMHFELAKSLTSGEDKDSRPGLLRERTNH